MDGLQLRVVRALWLSYRTPRVGSDPVNVAYTLKPKARVQNPEPYTRNRDRILAKVPEGGVPMLEH